MLKQKLILSTLTIVCMISIIVGCNKDNITTEPFAPSVTDTINTNNNFIRINLPANTSMDDSRRNWEDSIVSALILAYNANDNNPNKLPRISYRFNELDIASRTSVIPTTDASVAGETLDFYALINCREEVASNPDVNITHSELLNLQDYNTKERYNSSKHLDPNTEIIGKGGLFMFGSSLQVPPNQNTPVDVTLDCKRVMAKLDIQINTDDRLFTADVTRRGNAHATIKMKYATLVRFNRSTNILDPNNTPLDDFLAPYTAVDTLIQENGEDVHFHPQNGRFSFYTFPTQNRGTITYPFNSDVDNDALKLQIYFEYYPDQNASVYYMYSFYVPVLGGNNSSIAQALQSNTEYRLELRVVGIGGAFDQNGQMIPHLQPLPSSASQLTKTIENTPNSTSIITRQVVLGGV